jgi:hypothetical protein
MGDFIPQCICMNNISYERGKNFYFIIKKVIR